MEDICRQVPVANVWLFLTKQDSDSLDDHEGRSSDTADSALNFLQLNRTMLIGQQWATHNIFGFVAMKECQ